MCSTMIMCCTFAFEVYMFLDTFFLDLIIDIDILRYIFVAFSFYGTSLSLQKLILKKGI